MSILESFVALDFETTGIEPFSSEIIEVAVVRVQNGQIVDSFQTLVQPRKMPSVSIQRLTGITADELRGQPSLEAVMAKLRRFVGASPLISHNADFEVSRLRMSIPVAELPTVFDTVELARIAVPRLPNHRLETLVDAFSINNPEQHRALGDAQTLVEVFRALVNTLRTFSPARLETLARLARSLPRPAPPYGAIADLLLEIQAAAARSTFDQVSAPPVRIGALTSLPNTFGAFDEDKLDPASSLEDIDTEAVAKTLGAHGDFARATPAYEVRQSQIDMARAVTEVLNEGGTLLCEAGTGTGKSLAYLVPSVTWAWKNSHRVVISTHTKNLQEQLFYKDLPLVAGTLDIPVRSVVLKGKNNYVCLHQWHEEIGLPAAEAMDASRALLLPLVCWIDETESGDLEENGAFQTLLRYIPGAYSLAGRLSSEGKPCGRRTCRYYDRCFVTRVRRAAQQAHIIVVNHSLLFSDLAADHGVIGEYENLIVDEAHTFEETAIDYLGTEFSLPLVRSVLDEITTPHARSLLTRIRANLRRSKIEDATRKSFEVQLGATGQAAELAGEKAEAFFRAAKNELGASHPSSIYSSKMRYSSETNVFDEIREYRDDLFFALKTLHDGLQTLALWLRDLPMGGIPEQDELLADAELRQADLARLTAAMDLVTRAEDEDMVYWSEMPPHGDETRLKFVAAPLDVGATLRKDFYPGLRSLVMTSATLSVAEKFNYFRQRLGLEDDSVRTMAVKSPFDFDNQVHIALPGWFPEPRDPDFEPEVISLLQVLIPKIHRGTLVLFTSHGMLENAYSALKQPFEEQGILLLGQRFDGSRSSITNRFRQDRQSVLFGTESFWQGIDVPGEALELLIIVKLPFSVPGEPLEAAQSEALAAAGKNPFLHLAVPKAAIRFRQGFGRLIRHRNDRGAVLILDTRLVSKDYGRAFHRSLPASYTVYRSQEELIAGFEAWFSAEVSTKP
ncbi:MAG TPA: helicase C-terminal domain-containing protein [Candidatus Latescibacteria bacterium]|nr:helicase C-terminal domain-containing protein [Candidatus Latescibacterota bacterium]